MYEGIPSRYVPTGEKLSGATGDVLICQDTNLERDVAIKFIKNIQNQKILIDELNALQEIRSKNVVQIFDVFKLDNGSIGIVQEYVSGEDLQSFINTNKISLSKDDYLKILYQIASGINDIHKQGLIHRDIKPKNMKFDTEKILKIFDFGLARFAGKNDSTIGFTGTPGFAAPELYDSGNVSFTNTIDVYAFGVTAWKLLSGKIPEPLLTKPPLTKYFPSFAEVPLELPKKVIEILDLSLSEDPGSRPKISGIRDIIGKYILFGKHKALLVYGSKVKHFERVNQVVKLEIPDGSLHIKYDGLDFLVELVDGAVYINNKTVTRGEVLPNSCVITLGKLEKNKLRAFITFDISNPEVVL